MEEICHSKLIEDDICAKMGSLLHHALRLLVWYCIKSVMTPTFEVIVAPNACGPQTATVNIDNAFEKTLR